MAYAYGSHLGNWFTDIVQAVAPPNTIVGKAAAGDWSGAGAATVKLVGTAVTAKAKPAPTSPPIQQGGLASAFSPGGFVDQNKTVLLVVAAGLGAYLLMGRRR